ncbi:hypothetical protein M5K25_003755 [Dendrobium thyrsiflorum]|uniref:Retrotransposon gag domain-containing protein n=1 Tax=Dendrobium thyrsiflorum TaxID=117978 RepID=A0ABD0VJV9_DENTH
MRRQMRAKDKEISQLNEKMTEMMAQMTAMMQMMQRTAAAGTIPNPPTDLSILRMPQVSRVRGTPEGGHKTHNVVRQPTPQNIASTSEPVTAAQLEGIITEKIKAIIAIDHAEKLVGKGRPYPLEYDQVPYPKGYSVPKFYTFDGNKNPRQHLAQFKATYGNTGGNDALLFRQFVSSSAAAFEWYAELPNDSVRTFAELETMFVKRFASATEKITIADLALEKRKREESVTKYITRWRNLSMKCEQQLEEEHAVQLLMGNIDDKMQPFLCMATITTFQDLLDRVAKFEKLNLSRSYGHFDKHKKIKASGARRGVNSSSNVLFRSPIDDRKNDKKPVQEEKWETAVSKKTAKMLKQLEKVLGVKWKSPTEPVLNLKGLPNVQASTSKQHLNQDSSSKPGKPKFFKKKTKPKKPKEKKTVTQKVIDSLDEHYQTVRQPIKLADFMSELKIGETEEDGDADFLPTEVCRVISVAPGTLINEKYVKKEAPEACMMVLPMDCSSEEDLYFPEEGESDPDIASQMEHVNLGGDSESADESPDATMADSEENVLSNESEPEVTAQVQLRSGKILPPPPKKGVSDKDKGKEIVINEDIIPKDPKRGTAAKGIDYNILSHLRKIPAQLSIYDALVMSKDLRETLIQALKDPERYEAYFAERNMTEVLQARNEPFITFSEEDMMLGTEHEKKPVGRKKALPTLPKPVTPKERKHVPHLGSDTDEDDVTPTKSQRVSRSITKGRREVEYAHDDYNYDSIYTNTVHDVFSRRISNLSISDIVLVVTRIPLQCFREIIPRKVHDVEELTTFYVPPLREKGEPASLFYSIGRLDEDINRDWFCNLVDSGELVPTRFPRPDPTRPNTVGSLAAPSSQYARRKAVVAEPPLRQSVSEDCMKYEG